MVILNFEFPKIGNSTIQNSKLKKSKIWFPLFHTKAKYIMCKWSWNHMLQVQNLRTNGNNWFFSRGQLLTERCTCNQKISSALRGIFMHLSDTMLDFILRALWALRPCDPQITQIGFCQKIKKSESETAPKNMIVLPPADISKLFLFPRYYQKK